MACIYEIRNKITGEFYIGSAVDHKRRRKDHLNRLKRGTHHSRYLQNAWNKYGPEAFEFNVLLEKVDLESLYSIENERIATLKPHYNMMIDVFSHLGMKRTEETKNKISRALTGRKLSPEHREACRVGVTGTKQSAETIRKRMANRHKPILAFNKDGTLFREFGSATIAAAELGIGRMMIYEVIHGRRKTYRNLIWKRK